MKSLPLVGVIAGATIVLAGCSDNSTAPEPKPEAPVHHYTRADLHPEGNVIETADGYTVEGALRVDNEGGQTTFLNADLDIKFDEGGTLKSVSGTTEIPPPNDNVSFANPIQADVGFFTGKFLNENRDLPILLKDQIEYFIFYASLTVEMKVKDDDTPEEKALSIKAPVGGSVLFVADYTDPMYFIYGEQDLLGASGQGQSWQGRIPYRPLRPTKKIYSFDGKNIRVGTFEMKKIFSIDGTGIERSHSGIDMMFDPIDAQLEAGYAYGINGSMDLDLTVKNVIEFTLPLADGSAGVRAEASTGSGAFAGAFIDGIAEPVGWWPNIIPFAPIASLTVRGNVQTSGEFDLLAHGEFGIAAHGDPEKLVGDLHVTPDALTVAGSVVTGGATYTLAGEVTETETTIAAIPPRQLLDRISGAVNDELDQSIAEAEEAWNDLQKATENYEFELSLRGFRPLIAPAVDVARSQLSSNINNQLSQHDGTAYHDQLRDFLYSADDKYHNALNNLKTQAQATTDSDAWRTAIEAALRLAANYQYFDETFEYRVLGVLVKTVHVRIQILTNDQVAQLRNAADNVHFIRETSDTKIRAQEIYDSIPDKAIFERVRDDIENGVVKIPAITAIGYVQPRSSDEIAIFADIGGERYEVGEANLFDLVEMSASIAAQVVTILTTGP